MVRSNLKTNFFVCAYNNQRPEKKISKKGDQDQNHLQLLDWRFLLPETKFGNAAYFGEADQVFFSTMKKVCDSLTIVSPSKEKNCVPGNITHFDLIVARSVDLADIQRGASLLKPQGSLYWEIDRLQMLRSSNIILTARHNRVRRVGLKYPKTVLGMWNIKDFIITLKTFGFCEVEVYWHRPNFKACLEMIPMLNSNSLNFVFSRGHSSLRGRFKLHLGRFLWKTGLLIYFVPCLSIVACKQKC